MIFLRPILHSFANQDVTRNAPVKENEFPVYRKSRSNPGCVLPTWADPDNLLRASSVRNLG